MSGNEQSYRDEEDRQSHYTYGSSFGRVLPPHIDPDFDEIPPEYRMNELDRMIQEYGRKIMCEGGTWKCRQSGIERIRTICEIRDIPFERITRVEKYLDGWWR